MKERNQDVSTGHYDCPEDFLPGYDIITVSNFCHWRRCFRGFGGCFAGPRISVLRMSDLKKRLRAIYSINQEAKILLNAPNFLKLSYQKIIEKNSLSRRALKALADFNAERDNRCYFAIQATPASLIEDTEQAMALMIPAGIKDVWLGVESASREMRDRFSKEPFDTDELVRVTRRLKESGIACMWYLVYSVIDTDRTIEETLQLVRRVRPSRIYFHQCVAYHPGEHLINIPALVEKSRQMLNYEHLFERLAKELKEGV